MGEADSIAVDAAPEESTVGAGVRSPSIGWLAARCVLGASITAALFLIAFWLGLPEYDGAKSAGLGSMFDSITLGFALPVAGLGAAFAFFLSYAWRGHVDPDRAVRFICGSTWCATALGAYAFAYVGIPIALGALISSSLLCRYVLGRSRARR